MYLGKKKPKRSKTGQSSGPAEAQSKGKIKHALVSGNALAELQTASVGTSMQPHVSVHGDSFALVLSDVNRPCDRRQAWQ